MVQGLRSSPRPELLPKVSKRKLGNILTEHWKSIEHFPGYSVSDYGRIRFDRYDRILKCNLNQYGVLQVGMMADGEQRHRSVPLLVAKAFLPEVRGPFDTPINLDGDRTNNHVDNLMWRPRWFAIKYNRQFQHSEFDHIDQPVVDLKTGEKSENSLECAKRYGLLEEDVALSIENNTYAWPTYQRFGIVDIKVR
jgi:hypothetical protein